MFGGNDEVLKLDGTDSSFGVDDLAVAFEFYKETLGLKPVMDPLEKTFNLFREGSTIWVIEKKDYQPSNQPVLVFRSRKLERTIEELTARGVVIEPFDPYEELSREERGIAPDAETETVIVSFKDPAGNRFAVMREF